MKNFEYFTNYFHSKIGYKVIFFKNRLMSQNNQIRLRKSCVLGIPIQSFEKDFSFIVNGKEFRTNRLVADLLSPNICQIHQIDPTSNIFEFNTKNNGDFSNILSLINFKPNDFLENELPFVLEVLEILGTELLEIYELNEFKEMSNDNIFTLINKHKKYGQFYSKQLGEEITFISSHFFELCEKKEEDLINLDINILQSILNNPKLKANDEDQLLRFVNKLYSKNPDNSFLYETILFSNVSNETMEEFASLFDINDITGGIWHRLTERLTNKKIKSDRYAEFKHLKEIPYQEGQQFSGIIKYLRDKTSNKIDNEIVISHSSLRDSGQEASNVVLYERSDKYFCSGNNPDSWICFEFKKHRIILTGYQIQTTRWGSNWNPKSWIVEGSLDGDDWKNLDEQKDYPYLKEYDHTCNFTLENHTKLGCKFIRFRQTGPNWNNSNYFSLRHVELYGNIYEI